MEKLKAIILHKKAKTAYWGILNTLAVLILTMINDGDIKIDDAVVASILIAGLNFLTKYLNTKK